MMLPRPIADLSDSESVTVVEDEQEVATPSLTGSMEIFAGSGNLSAALKKQGLPTVMIDIRLSASHDMSLRSTIDYIMTMVKEKQIGYVHMAPPCNTFSSACFPRKRQL